MEGRYAHRSYQISNKGIPIASSYQPWNGKNIDLTLGSNGDEAMHNLGCVVTPRCVADTSDLNAWLYTSKRLFEGCGRQAARRRAYHLELPIQELRFQLIALREIRQKSANLNHILPYTLIIKEADLATYYQACTRPREVNFSYSYPVQPSISQFFSYLSQVQP